MARDLTFTTSISGHTSQGLVLRGHNLSELINQADFVATVFLSMTGREPTSAEKFIFNALLVAAIDHGLEPASGFVPRVVAASGNEITVAMASSLLALGQYHGAAITPSMTMLQQLNQAPDVEQACRDLVRATRDTKQKLMGFGHPIYKDVDPRTQQLFSLARQQQLSLDFINIALTLEQIIEEELGKKLVINIDGAIATLLLTLKFEPLSGNAIFALARAAGSIAHILEEYHLPPSPRRLDPSSIEYKS